MIRIQNVTKVFWVHGKPKVILDNVSAIFPTGVTVGLLGRNGAGKSSLLQMISGVLDVTSGRISSTGTISSPVGFAGSFNPEMTGAQNTRFVARLYAVDSEALSDFVQDFADLGDDFYKPVRTYSSGMRGRLSFGVSMGLHFDTYLIDETTAVGDINFRAKSERLLYDRLSRSRAIVCTHGVGLLRRLCQAGAVLEKGQLTYFDNIDDAIALHDAHMGEKSADYDDD
jgi:capsular polysaccharide transport system ATP-binding protein